MGIRAVFINEAPRSLSAVATQPSVLAVIDDKAFLYLVHETPTFALQVMRSMAERISERDPQAWTTRPACAVTRRAVRRSVAGSAPGR